MSWRRTAPGHRTRGGGNGQLILPSTAKGRQGNALVHGRGLYRGDVDRGPRTGLDGFTPVLKDEKSNSVAEGYGQCTWPDGIHYEGEWRDGLPHGEGTQVFANGETYAGEWQRGIRHGFGQWCSREGHEYCGYWKDGLFHGQGQLWLQGGGGYWGPYERGNMHGMGLLAWPDGFVTMALFQHGLRHGNALEFLNEDWIAVRADAIYDRDRLVSRQPADVVKNGSVILDTEGRRAGRLVGGRAISFEEGKRARNRGVRAQLNDGGAYTGQIRLGRLDGRGKVVYWQGCEDKNDAIRSYEGLFCADKRHGVGIGKWDVSPYETVYAGAWQDGKPSGPGIMTWPDGTEYKGEFSEARPHGFGVLNVPGKFSVATGKMGPAVEICGIFHRGRPYIRADGQERAGFKGETEAIHLEIPSPRPVAELPISGRRTRSTRRSSGPHTPLKKDAEIHKAAIPDVVDMATQGKRNEEGLSDGREIKLDRLHAERHDELSSLHWKVDGFPQAQLQMKLAARNLKKMDGLFGKSDPYLVLKRAIVREKAHNDSVDTLSTVADDKKVESVQSMESTYLEHRKDGDTSMEAQLLGSTLPNEQEHIAIGTAVYRTEVVVDTLDPTWEEIVMPLESLCLEKHAPNDAFVIECWDYDKVSAPDLIGSVRTSISQIIASQTRELELALIDGNGKTGVGFLRILRAVVIGPTTCPPSLLTGESLKRLAHRASLIATSVADMTLWERGLDRQEGLLNASSVFQCMRPPGPMPERPIWRRNAIDDKEKQEALGLTAPITLKESVEAYNKEFEDELSADMLSLNPPPPPSRRRRPVTFAAAPPSHDSSSDDAGLMKINSSGEGGNARAGSAEDEVHEQREPQREEELEDRGIVDVDDLARKEPLEEMLEESEQKREGSSQTECQDEQDARSEGIGGGGDDKSVVESEGSQWGDDGALLGGNISEWVRLDEAEGACADVTARNDNLQCVSEIQKEDGEEAQEMEEIVQNLEPRKLEVTVVTARDVPVKSYAPAGSGLYVVIEFQDQMKRTTTRLWNENLRLDTSQTFGITHESCFFDWGEKLFFNLSDMERIASEGASELRIFVRESDPVAEAARQREEVERLAAIALAEETRRREEEEEALREEQSQERRAKMTHAELMADHRAEKEREKRERERMKERMREQEERDRILSSDGLVARSAFQRGESDEATEDDETESDLVGAGILPVDLMTRVACTNIGWEGEGFVGLSRGDMKVVGADGKRESGVVLRLRLLNQFCMAIGPSVQTGTFALEPLSVLAFNSPSASLGQLDGCRRLFLIHLP